MAFTYITGISANATSYGTDLALGSTFNIAAGDVLVAFCAGEVAFANPAISDGGSNTFTMGTLSTGSNAAAMGYVLNAAANSTATITLTTDESNYRHLIVMQFRPDSGETVTLDDSSHATGTGTTADSGAIDTTGTDVIVVAGQKSFSTGEHTSLQIGGAAATGTIAEYMASACYKIFSSTQSGIHATASVPDDAWNCHVVAIKSTAGGGVEITAGVGALAASGKNPALDYGMPLSTGVLTLAGNAPTRIERGLRYAYPMADITDGTWLPSTGTELYTAIDEDPASDTDYIYTNAAGACEIRLLPVTDPASSSGYALNYRIWSPVGGNAVVRLKQGATTIATWTHTGLPTTATDYSQALSGAEADSITDHDDLRIEIEAT